MKLELRNIGPVNKAAVDLDGISLLVGPNASGKTTISTVAYSLLQSRQRAQQAVEEFVLENTIGGPRVPRGPLDARKLGDQFSSAFRAALGTELTRNFSPDLSKLPRRGRSGNGSAPRIAVSDHSRDYGQWKLVFRITDAGLTLERSHPEYRLPDFAPLLNKQESYAVSDWITRWRDSDRRAIRPVYFPAARSGYVQMQSVLAQLLLAALGRGYFEQVAVGKISGVTADFLQFLAAIDPSRRAGLPPTAVDRIERELVHGHLRMVSAGEASRIIEFSPEGIPEYWPMDAAATSVAELAPLLLYLRHSAEPQDVLFIDEPEAHLHPRNQMVFADVLLDLAGLLDGMVIGTHSEFLVTGISNGLLRRRAADKETVKVSLHVLHPAGSTGGFEAEAVRVDHEDGFTVSQFADVAEEAWDEAEELFENISS